MGTLTGTGSDTPVVTDVNDAPTITVTANDFTEDAGGLAAGTSLAGTYVTDDLGDGDTLTVTFTSASPHYTVDQSGNVFLTAAAITAINVGDDLDAIALTVTDNGLGTLTGTGSDTPVVTDVNDAPIVANSITDQNATEGDLFSFTLASDVFTDTDSPELTLSATLADNAALPAWLGFNSTTGIFTGTPTDADVGSYGVKVTADDGSGGIVSDNFIIEVGDVENAPVIGGNRAGFVTEDDDPNTDGLLFVADAMTVADLDVDESGFVSKTLIGTFGSLTVDESGAWTYTADNSQNALQKLDSGESALDIFSLETFDGTRVDITITINGDEDESIITGDTSGVVTAGATLSSLGSLVIEDVDTSDNPVSFLNIESTPGDSGYGRFEITNGNWIYTLGNDLIDLQPLMFGESLTDTLTFTATDDSTQQVSVTINGSNEQLFILDDVNQAILDDAPQDLNASASESLEAAAEEARQALKDATENAIGAGPSTQADEVEQAGESETEAETQSDAQELAAVDLSEVLNIYGQTVSSPSANQGVELGEGIVADILEDDNKSKIQAKALDRFIDLESLSLNQVEVNNAEFAELAGVVRSNAFSESLAQLGDSLDEALNEQDVSSQLRVASAAGIVAGVSTGILSQVLRAGALLASFMSVVPLWRQFDPLPILSSLDDSTDSARSDDEDKADDVDDEVEEIFNRPLEEDD